MQLQKICGFRSDGCYVLSLSPMFVECWSQTEVESNRFVRTVTVVLPPTKDNREYLSAIRPPPQSVRFYVILSIRPSSSQLFQPEQTQLITSNENYRVGCHLIIYHQDFINRIQQADYTIGIIFYFNTPSRLLYYILSQTRLHLTEHVQERVY